MKWRSWAGEDELDQVRIASPCPASWKHMHGNDQVRLCTHCDRNVYNLAEMTRDEGLRLIQEAEGRVCMRIYYRPDGRVMTKDCGRAVRIRVMAKAKLISIIAPIAAVFGATLWPVHAGEAESSRDSVQRYTKRLLEIEAEIDKTKDPEEREALEQIQDTYLEQLSQAVSRLEKD